MVPDCPSRQARNLRLPIAVHMTVPTSSNPDHPPGGTATPGDRVRVHKLRPDGSEKFAWDGVVLRVDADGIVLRSAFNVPLVDLGCVTLREGDIFIEFYRWGDCFTVAQVSAPDGTLKGWYCDVCTPAHWTASGQLAYADLFLDLWRDADGTITLLDEEEFAAHRAAGALTPAQLEAAERGWAALRALAER